MTIHEEIRAARLRKNWSMRQLAEAVSRAERLAKPLAWQTVQQWESGVSAPKRKRMATVVRLLELDAPAAPVFSRKGVGENAATAAADATGALRVPPLAGSATWMRELVLDRSWLRAHLPSVAALDALRLHGVADEAMAPTCRDGDVVLVDTAVRALQGEGLYLFDRGRMALRRVRQRLDGTLELVTDNPRFGNPEVLDRRALKHARVLGRAVWVLSGAKL